MNSSDNSFYTADSDSSYLSIDDSIPALDILLNKAFSPYPKNYNICHINAQSISAHYDAMLDYLTSDTIHAILVSETWLKPSLPSSTFPIRNCILIRNDRVGAGGGGVAIYLKSHIPYKTILQSPSVYSASPEYLFIEVNIGIKFVLGVVYCPPKIDYFSKLESALESLLVDYNKIYIMGDFNTCLIQQDNRSLRLKSLIGSSNLNVLPLSATHHSHTGDTLLDLIITSDTDLITLHGQFDAPGISHHDLIYASIKHRLPKPKPITLHQRNFARMSLECLNADAFAIKWSSVYSVPTIEDKIDFLTGEILKLFDCHAPIHPVKLKHKPSPWINSSIRKAMSRRNSAFRKYKHYRNEENWAEYKRLRNRCNQLCRTAKRQYIAEQIELSTPAGIWKFLRSIGIGKPKILDSKIPLDLNLLNKHFTTATILDPSTKLNTINAIYHKPRHNVLAHFDFSPVSEDSVSKIVQNIKSKATGNDEIGRIMLMYIFKHVLPALTHIINFSLSCGQFPDSWRKAHVLPLPKCPNPALPNQFRPISILPFLSKVIESIVHKQVTDYLTTAELFNTYQSGFRAGHSTTTALLRVTEDIRTNMQNTHVTILVLIDFSNAFNVVDHDVLLAVLESLNFSPIAHKWFSSYLKGRKQIIRDGQRFSEWRELVAGVPQGGILSPLLFSVFINMLSTDFCCKYHFYADDLQLYHHSSIDDLHYVINLLNNDLLHLLSWSQRFGIKVNPDKCQAIIVGSTHQLRKIDHCNLSPLKYNDCVIPFSDTVKDLGLIIDANLCWVPQINEVSRKFYAALHSIIRHKRFLPTDTKITLVNTLLLPIIDYADICYLDLSEGHLNKLDRLLNACIRFIFCLRKYDHVSEYRLKLKWLKIRERKKVRILGLLYSILNNPYSPSYLRNSISFLSDLNNLDLRSSNNLLLDIPLHSTSFVEKSWCVVAPRLWNELPLSIRQSPSKEVFKRRVREHFYKIS